MPDNSVTPMDGRRRQESSTVTVQARLATVVAAAALLVAVSGTAGAVAASLVTSKDIKNGTIQPRDLDKQIRASLRKGATALHTVPGNSVSSVTVRDGSLRLSDLVTATGSQGFAPQTFLAGTCSTVPAVDTRHVTTGALVLAQTSLGRLFTVTGQPDLASSTAIDITVCNNSAVDYAADGAGGDTFRWELIGR